MKKNVIILFLALGVFTACQEDDGLAPNSQITAISPADLPVKSQVFIDNNFNGEVVTDAYKVIGTDHQVTYEAFISNNINLIFQKESDLIGFGNINSRMEMEGESFDGGMQGYCMQGNGGFQNGGMMGEGNGGMMGEGNGGMMGNGNGGVMGNGNGGMMGEGFGGMVGEGFHEFRNHPEITPVELNRDEIPTTIVDYLSENYPDKEILKAFEIVWDDGTVEFHVLIQDIGGLLFDANGNFKDMIRRGSGHCADYEEITVGELPENVLEYIESNYPDNEIIRAKLGSHDDIEEIYVLLEDVGVLIFDIDGNFVEIIKRRMPHHG